MKSKKWVYEVIERLKAIYPEAVCALHWGNEGWKLLIMGRLSAQCTDARVNIVCEELFSRWTTVEAIADAELAELEAVVRPCGLYKVKAKNIKDACRILADRYEGQVPDTMEELLELPGVGRKIANLLLGDLYHRPAVVTDTHCIRICGRLGFYPESLKDPVKIEKLLMTVIPPEEQSDFCHRLVQFGRDVCSARVPQCGECTLCDICAHGKKMR